MREAAGRGAPVPPRPAGCRSAAQRGRCHHPRGARLGCAGGEGGGAPL